MAWLSGLTNKAEQFLNQIDQSASAALKEPANNPQSLSNFHDSQTTTVSQPRHPPQSFSRQDSLTSSHSVPSKLQDLNTFGDSSSSFVSTPLKPQTSLKSQSDQTQKPQTEAPILRKAPQDSPSGSSPSLGRKTLNSDEALFEFLNSNEPAEGVKKKSTPRHSRQSSTSSTVSSKNGRSTEPMASTSGSSVSIVQVEKTESEGGSPTEAEGSPDLAALADAMLEQSPSNSVHSSQDVESHSESHQRLSSLELENKLLKNEVGSLNQEMASVIERAKKTQTELVNVKRMLDERNTSLSQHDQVVRELQSREADLMEALTAKDSQLAVLRIRLEEADRQIQDHSNKVQALAGERERILKDHTDSSGMHGQALDSLKEKLAEVEAALRREQEAYKKAQQESTARQSKLEQEQHTLAESLTAADRKLSEERGKVTDMSIQLKNTKSNLEAAKHELSDYKEKATRILQSKERLIASLREGSGASGEAVGVSSMEYDSVKQERDMFRDELQQSKMTTDNLRMELQEVEIHLQQDSDSSQDQIHSLEENLREETQKREDMEQEILKQKQELQYAIEEMHRQKTAFQTRLNDRESDIEKLRNQLTTKSLSSTTESELESRVKALTESLIQKQTMLEALSTEKNSLTLQLERMEQQYRDAEASAMRTHTSVIHVHEDDDSVRQRVPGFMREGPTDTEVTRRMKRAANTIDKFSIRLGIFLRRYPIARVFVILYMAMLHMWVMVVLLTYQPEIHGVDHAPQPPVP